MLVLDLNDPYPLTLPHSHTYAEAQAHSAQVDAWLGLQTERIEAALIGSVSPKSADQELWIGLPVKSLLTPYTEIRSLLTHLQPAPGSRVVDLGAGYGRMGFVIGRHYPEIYFTGYEIVEERVVESRRCLKPFGYPRVMMEVADLGKMMPIQAEFYFLYDFGSRALIEKTLQDLRQLARNQKITVIARGRASRDAIERRHPWLSQVHPPEHFDHFSVYRSG